MKKSIAKIAAVAIAPVVAEFTPEQQAQVLLDAFNSDFDLDIAMANAAIVAATLAPATPAAKATLEAGLLLVAFEARWAISASLKSWPAVAARIRRVASAGWSHCGKWPHWSNQ